MPPLGTSGAHRHKVRQVRNDQRSNRGHIPFCKSATVLRGRGKVRSGARHDTSPKVLRPCAYRPLGPTSGMPRGWWCYSAGLRHRALLQGQCNGQSGASGPCSGALRPRVAHVPSEGVPFLVTSCHGKCRAPTRGPLTRGTQAVA